MILQKPKGQPEWYATMYCNYYWKLTKTCQGLILFKSLKAISLVLCHFLQKPCWRLILQNLSNKNCRKKQIRFSQDKMLPIRWLLGPLLYTFHSKIRWARRKVTSRWVKDHINLHAHAHSLTHIHNLQNSTDDSQLVKSEL